MFDSNPLADPPAYTYEPGSTDSRLLVICDHASPVIPARYGDLGLGVSDRMSHIAWDIGAAEVARLLAARLDAHLLLAGASRLLVDLNRAPGDPGWMPSVSCGVEVPGNRHLSINEQRARRSTWYDPYHRALADCLGEFTSVPAVIAIHSFTPCLGAAPRPWHVGVLWNRDDRLSRPAIAALEEIEGLSVGDNQPYSAQEFNHTLDTHAGRAGIPHISFEIRHDLIADPLGQKHWAELLERVLAPLLANPDLYHLAPNSHL